MADAEDSKSSAPRGLAGSSPASGTSRRGRLFTRLLSPLALLLAAQALWCGWFIWRTSFVALGQRAFCLFDDAMISMTYAQNLVAGHGLNWARFGAPVEGFTHPLWLVPLVAIHLLPVDSLHTSLLVQLFSLALLVANVLAIRRLMLRHFSPGDVHYGLSSWLPAALLTASYYPLNHWALQGFESGLQALVVTLAVHLTLDISERGERRHLALGTLLGASHLLRPDLLPLIAACLGYLVLAPHEKGRRLVSGRREWLALLGPFVLAVVGYGLFRWFYFNELLPNTYYLKMTGLPLDVTLLRGLWTFTFFLRPIFFVLLALALGVALRARARPRLLLPSAVALLFFAYSIWVGGDVWEIAPIGANRFVCFAVPMVFVVANALLNDWLASPAMRARSAMAHGLAWGGLAIAALLSFNGLLVRDPTSAWDRLLVLQPPLHVAEHRHFTRLALGLQRSGLVDRDARMAVVWAGIPAYFSNWEMVDTMGYNERHLAHGPANAAVHSDTYRRYMPGHVKSDLAYAVDTYLPDLVLHTWDLKPEQERELLRSRGYVRRAGLWVRKSSAKVRLDGWPETPEPLLRLGRTGHESQPGADEGPPDAP